jgi:hypothetical protein
MLASSVADLESGAFLTPGSGMGKKLGSGRDEQPGKYFRELGNNFWLKYLNSLMRIRDSGWKKFGSGIRDNHPGSATLEYCPTIYGTTSQCSGSGSV